MAARLALVTAACSDGVVGPGGEAKDQLLLVSNLDGGVTPAGWPRHDIYRMNADGTRPQNLTRHPTTYRFLSLSPDGRKVAFESYRSGYDVWVMNVDGTGPARLTNRDGGRTEGENTQPQWSPDGTLVAFASNRAGRTRGTASGLSDVYVVNADGSNPRNLSRPLWDELGLDVRVVGWSPGRQVVFESSEFAGGALQYRVYLVNPDGTGLRTLFPGGVDHSPAWSPDASRIAFISRRDGRDRLYVMNADGSGARPLTAHAGQDRLPGASNEGREMVYSPWSPDGTRIVFQRVADVYDWGSLNVVNVDGTGLRRLTADYAGFNGWSPRGDRILFTSREAGSNDVFSIRPEGWGRLNLTRSLSGDPYDDRNALWLPGR